MVKPMQAGDILFVRGNSLMSNIVRFFDKGEFSHVAIALTDTHVLESQYYTKSHIIRRYFYDYEIVSLNLSELQKADALRIGVNLVGQWYDYRQALGYMFNKEINNPNQMICSEMVAVFLYRLGLIDDLESFVTLTPNQLYKKLKSLS